MNGRMDNENPQIVQNEQRLHGRKNASLFGTRLPFGWWRARGVLPLFGAIAAIVWSCPLACAAEPSVVFRDVTAESGIDFRHTDGSSGRRYVIESFTAGLALLDYDLDGDLDIYFVNGAPLPGTEASRTPVNSLYRNDGQWRFTDVTDQAGVGDPGYGMGVAAADYDNDGDADLYVNNFGPNVLYRNNGDGTFSRWTDQARVANGERVGAGVTFFDMDSDGDLDLYVANYIQYSFAQHTPHMLRGRPAYPSPLNYLPDPDTLYRNNGDGTFDDVSVESGVASQAGAGMGIVSADYDNDGDTDVFVGNDVGPNFLWNNDGTGRFTDVALLAGTAYDLTGHAQATMGVDAADFNNDGLIDFYATSYSRELATLYRNLGGGAFEDATRITDAGSGTLPHVTWGDGFADFDNDGDRDLFIACGHVDDNLDVRGGDDTTAFKVPNIVLRNDGGRFVNISVSCGDGLEPELASRGAVLGDLDEDGRVDIVVLNTRDRATVLRNDSPAQNHWIELQLTGIESNRSGIGARVTVTSGELVQMDEVRSGRGYQGDFGPRLHFGLGSNERIDRIDIRWPGGTVDVLRDLRVDRIVRIIEGTAERK